MKTVLQQNKDLDLRRFGKDVYTKATNKSEGKNEENLSELQNKVLKGIFFHKDPPENFVYPDLLLYAPLIEDPETHILNPGEPRKVDSASALIDVLIYRMNNVLYAYYKNNPFGESPHTIDGSDSNTYIVTEDNTGIVDLTTYDEQYGPVTVDVLEKVIDGETYYEIVPHPRVL